MPVITLEDGVYVTDGSTEASAIMQFDSTTKGALFPRMTTAQRDAIDSPATGLTIYNTTTNENNSYNGSSWVGSGGGGGSHASDHLTGGSDEIDGDKLDIDFTPTNYTPATTPSEADNVDNLTAHLYGIDQALSSSSITIAHNPGTYYVPSNITSTASSWADIDATNIKETVVVASGDIVEVTFHLPSIWQTTGVDIDLRIVADDGSNTLDDNSYEVTVSTTEERSVLLIALFTGLPADTYDFKPQWQKPSGGGSMIVDADTAVTWNVRVTS